MPLRPLTFAPHSPAFRRDTFSCGDREIDGWFRSKSWADHRRRKHVVTCATFDDATNEPVGFYALSAVVEDMRVLPEASYSAFRGSPLHFPCLNLVYVAVRRDLQGQGLGRAIMGRVIVDEFADIGERTGLPLLIVTPGLGVAPFYRRLGFEPYRQGSGLYLSLEAAIDARG